MVRKIPLAPRVRGKGQRPQESRLVGLGPRSLTQYGGDRQQGASKRKGVEAGKVEAPTSV